MHHHTDHIEVYDVQKNFEQLDEEGQMEYFNKSNAMSHQLTFNNRAFHNCRGHLDMLEDYYNPSIMLTYDRTVNDIENDK